MPNDKLHLLIAELQAIELWDRAGKNAAPDDEINRAGTRAREMRRLEITREISALRQARSSGTIN
jgi:hypothetical protein